MASHPISEPLNVLLSTLPSLPRPLLNRLVERAIDHMDEQDGDPDMELSGDGYWLAEDEFCDHPLSGESAAGCPISDPPEDDHDREPTLGWSAYAS